MVFLLFPIKRRISHKSNHLGRQDDRQSAHLEGVLLFHILLLALQHRPLRFARSRLPRLDQHIIALSHRPHADLRPHHRLDSIRMPRQRRQRTHPAMLAGQGTCSSLLSQVMGSHAAVSLLLFRIVSARSLTVAFAGRPVAGRRRSKIVREKL